MGSMPPPLKPASFTLVKARRCTDQPDGRASSLPSITTFPPDESEIDRSGIKRNVAPGRTTNVATVASTSMTMSWATTALVAAVGTWPPHVAGSLHNRPILVGGSLGAWVVAVGPVVAGGVGVGVVPPPGTVVVGLGGIEASLPGGTSQVNPAESWGTPWAAVNLYPAVPTTAAPAPIRRKPRLVKNCIFRLLLCAVHTNLGAHRNAFVTQSTGCTYYLSKSGHVSA